MEIKHLIQRNRSYRRFDTSVSLSDKDLESLVELTRYAASARNMQPLRYVLSTTKDLNDRIFPLLAWAGYLSAWPGPGEKERPAGYIVMCKETALSDAHVLFDAGLAAQNILLGATAQGLGGCIIGAIQKSRLREVLHLPDIYEILYVIALGEPVETIVIEDAKDNNIKYWRDENQVHHVPKRTSKELILNL